MPSSKSETALSSSVPVPCHQVVVPGRANLIGEHIDYHNLPVLPIALRRSIRMHFSLRCAFASISLTLGCRLQPLSFCHIETRSDLSRRTER